MHTNHYRLLGEGVQVPYPYTNADFTLLEKGTLVECAAAGFTCRRGKGLERLAGKERRMRSMAAQVSGCLPASDGRRFADGARVRIRWASFVDEPWAYCTVLAGRVVDGEEQYRLQCADFVSEADEWVSVSQAAACEAVV